MIRRQQKFEVAGFCVAKNFLRQIDLVILDERLPDRQTLCLQKCVSHASADQHRIGNLHQVFDDFNLVADFRTAENCHKRPCRIAHCLAQIRQFFFHQQSSRGLTNKFCDSDHGSMRAVRGTERIANEEPVTKCRKLLRKCLVVFLFFGMKPHIL